MHNSAVRTAASAFAEIRENAQIRDGFQKIFLGQGGSILNYDVIEKERKTQIDRLLQMKSADAGVIYRSLFVQSCSIFELFFRQIIKNTIGKISEMKLSVGSLGNDILATGFYYTGIAFQRERDLCIKDGPARFQSWVDALLTFRDGAEVVLPIAPFVDDLGNCTTEKIDKRLKQLRIPEIFAGSTFPLGKDTDIKKWAGAGGANEVHTRAKRQLDELIAKRNSLVHPKDTLGSVSFDELIECVDYFEALTAAIGRLAVTKD